MQIRDEILKSSMGNERLTVMLLLDIRDLLIEQNKKIPFGTTQGKPKRKYNKRSK